MLLRTYINILILLIIIKFYETLCTCTLYDHLHFSIQYKHISSLLNCQKHFDESTVLKDRELVSPCNTIASHVSGTHAFVAPCQNIIKYLNHIQYSSYDGINKIDRCRYLNFYIHKQINSNYSNPLTQNTYNTYIQAFKSRYPELNVCNDNMKYIDKEVIVNIKKILDMYIKLDKVIKASDINQDNICSSATECLGTYRSFESDCKEGSHNNELCNALENFRSYLVNSTAGMGCMESIIFPSFNVAQEKTLELEGSRTAAASLQMKDPTDEEVPDLKSSNSKTITAISTTLLLFPSLFSLYKVYKEFLSKQKSGFTPLGSLIRPYIQRNEKVQYNANDEMLQLYLPNYKAQENINKEQLNVPYHS